MLDIKKCLQCRQGLEYSIAEGSLVSPRCNARVFYAIEEYAKRKRKDFREHKMEDKIG